MLERTDDLTDDERDPDGEGDVEDGPVYGEDDGEGDDEDLPGFLPPPEVLQRELQRDYRVFLLRGEKVQGPFHRPTPDGAPMLEVARQTVNGGKVRRGPVEARLAHDADEEALAEAVGGGRFYVCVRHESGRVMAGRSVQVYGASRVAAERPGGRPVGGERELELLREQLEGRDRHISALQGRVDRLLGELADLHEAKHQADLRHERELTDARVKSLEARLERSERGGGRGGSDELFQQLEGELDRAEKIKDALERRLGDRLRAAEPEEPEKDLVDEVGETFAKLTDNLTKAKGLLALLD